LIFGLALSIAFLGIGRIELFAVGGSISAWSVSRTTFFFWLAFKLFLLVRGGWAATGLARLKTLTPLFVFFSVVTLSLLPSFRAAGDYRYFFFGCAHAVMVADLFAGISQKHWLPLLCGVLPLVLVVRGLVDDPSVFNLVLAHRFEFPLDHANTAGYVFAMSIPLGLAVVLAGSPAWRSLGALSCSSQVFALLLTYSRGAWLGLAAALCFLLASARKWKYLVVLGILAVACLFAFPSIKDRVASLTAPSDDVSLSNRLYLSNAALALGLDHPVLGVGYGRGRLKEALRPRLQDTPLRNRPLLHSHNVYVELFAGTGLLGLLSFIWVSAGSLLRVAVTARKRDGKPQLLGFALAASWIGVIVAGIGDIPFYHHETRIFFFTLVAAAHVYYSSNGDSPSL
jgi:O-antigen ligase